MTGEEVKSESPKDLPNGIREKEVKDESRTEMQLRQK